MFELFIAMLERLGIIVTIAFILTRFRFFRDMIYREKLSWNHRMTAILFFGFFGIIGTYTGVTFNTDTFQFNRWTNGLSSEEAIANSRVIGVVIAGLLGGYRVGIGAGLIAGIHRFTMGGFTAIPCGLAAVVGGIIAAIFHKKSKHIKLPTAFFIGAAVESLQMVIILLLASPFDKALTLVNMIGAPMIIANGVGTALFLLVIRSVVNEEEKVGALQAQKSLRIANQTLVHLRKGLTIDSAAAVCKILHQEIHTIAISMTNQSQILAHIGLGDDHHKPYHPIQTDITERVLKEGNMIVAKEEEVKCAHKECALGAAVVAPLKQRGVTMGTIKFYFQSEKEISNVTLELISGLSILLSQQIELADAEHAHQLAKEAEIKVLQAQISPHFLFNCLNTIVSLIRIEPSQARKLLISLSHFLRQNLIGTTEKWTPLETELKHVQAYLSIEEARFVNKLRVDYDIDERLLNQKIPPLTLQPIVENAVKHGLKELEKGGVITISIKESEQRIMVSVSDNGSGIKQEHIQQLGKLTISSEDGAGVGLYNVNRRLMMMLGDETGLIIRSSEQGTVVSFNLPCREELLNGIHD
jgi:two-component system sensor histidine kinase LytS